MTRSARNPRTGRLRQPPTRHLRLDAEYAQWLLDRAAALGIGVPQLTRRLYRAAMARAGRSNPKEK